jgi:hypothetical protein
MTAVLDALLGLLLFNTLIALVLVVPCLFDDRRKPSRWHEATRHLAALWVQEPRVPPWEPFVETLEERRAARSARDIQPPD